MKKIIIPFLFFILLSAFSLAYNVVDYEPFNYTGGQSTLYSYGWRNTTGNGLPYCSATSGYLSCSGATTNVRIAHTLNSVPQGYCVSKNGSYGDFGSNFSIRFNLRLTEPIKSSADLVSMYSGSFINSTITSYFSDLESRTYANYSASQGEKYFWATAGGYSYNIYNTLTLGNWHTVQMDFFVTNATFPIGAQNIYAGNISMINDLSTVAYYFTGTNSFALTDYYCLNASVLRFNTDFNLDNLYVIQYNTTEKFLSIQTSINTSNATPPVSYQCSDGLDNDMDGYVDYPQDISCTSINDTTEDSFDSAECNDFIDNDEDGLTDMFDPNCSSSIDNTEYPQNFYQCNNGIDDDGDGYIDYPDDPSCTFWNDNLESPADGTTQSGDVCSQSNFCVFKETFPYTDSIFFHGWTDVNGSGIVQNVLYSTDYKLQLINYAGYTMNISKLFTNDPNAYSQIDGNIQMMFPTIGENGQFYIIFKNSADIAFKIKVVINDSAQAVSIISVDMYGNEYLAFTSPMAFTVGGYLPLSLRIDNANEIYTINDGIYDHSYIFWGTVFYDTISIEANGTDLNVADNKIYISSIQFSGTPLNASCTDFAPPYYLKEEFKSGSLEECGWISSPDTIQMIGVLDIQSAMPSFVAYKQMFDSNANRNIILTNRYIAVSFDFKIDVTNAAENIVSFSLWDSAQNKFLTVYINKNANGKGFSPDVTGDYFDTTAGTWNTVLIIFDMNSDKFSLYLNGVSHINSAGFDIPDLNVENLAFVMVESSYSKYQIDNVMVYVTDSSGNPLSQTALLPKVKTGNETTWFGLIYLSTPSCTVDSDCLSGSCTGYGKCSSFNYNKCDEEGYERGSYCMIGLTISGFFGWLAIIALDNFLYVILFMILLVCALFIWKLTRRER